MLTLKEKEGHFYSFNKKNNYDTVKSFAICKQTMGLNRQEKLSTSTYCEAYFGCASSYDVFD